MMIDELNALLSRREAVLTLRTYYEGEDGTPYEKDEYEANLEVYRHDDLQIDIKACSVVSPMDALSKLLEKCEADNTFLAVSRP